MKSWALVKDGVVVNIVAGGDKEFFESHPDYSEMQHIETTDIENKPTVGWLYEDGEFIRVEGETGGTGNPVLDEDVIIDDDPEAGKKPGLSPEE